MSISLSSTSPKIPKLEFPKIPESELSEIPKKDIYISLNLSEFLIKPYEAYTDWLFPHLYPRGIIWKKCITALKKNDFIDIDFKIYAWTKDRLRRQDLENTEMAKYNHFFAENVNHLKVHINFDKKLLEPSLNDHRSGCELFFNFITALPDDLTSLELSGNCKESIDVPGEPYFIFPSHLRKLVMRNLPINIPTDLSYRLLKELRITNSTNKIKDADLGLLKSRITSLSSYDTTRWECYDTLEILELDGSLGLTSKCFKELPRKLKHLFITIWPVNKMVQAQDLSDLPPNLEILELRVSNNQKLDLTHIERLPKERLTSLTCSLNENIKIQQIKPHLTRLEKFQPL